MIVAVLPLLFTLILQPTTQPSGPPDPSGDSTGVELASKIVKAHGGDVWPTVTRLKFTFNVEAEGTLKASIKHDWNVKTGVDTVSVGDKTFFTNVFESKERSGDELQAFKRWTNDSYWLMMPLKLLDGGVKFGPLISTRDFPPSRGKMTMSFGSVGITPGDQYDLAIDLKQNRIDHFTYRPDDKNSSGFTWENYKDFNGLVLSTEHKNDDGKTRIFFTDISVERK